MEKTSIKLQERDGLRSKQKRIQRIDLIELLDYKRPHEADRVGDLLFCPYHRVLGHKIQDCFVLN